MSLLRRSLLANAIYSTLTGLLATVFASDLAGYMSVPVAVLYVVGMGTMFFGLSIVWELWQPSLNHGWALAVVVADLAWVVAAVAIISIPGTIENGWLLGVVSVPVAIFSFLQGRGLVDTSRAEPRELVTQIDIHADPEVVWDQLTDLNAFSEWNPFMVHGAGEVSTGSELTVRMQPPGGRATTFNPVVTSAEPPFLFEWLGSLMIPGLFDGSHRFEIEPTAAGVTLTHSESFSGLLVPLLWSSLQSNTRAGFEEMNRALKDRAEGSVQHSV